MKNNRALSFLIIILVYAAAAAAGIGIYFSLPFDFWLSLLISDVAATVIVFVFSLIFGNASCYDPYWSVAPVVMVAVMLFRCEINAVRVLLAAAVAGWGIRLTANWAYTFRNLNWQDWRYVHFRNLSGVFYPLVNLFGIHMFPTLVVYACMLPAVFAFVNEVSFSVWTAVFAAAAFGSFVLQGVADVQMHLFRSRGTGGFIRSGLGKHSRHPNYLGEILMWWSVGLASVISMGGHYWLLAGALANTLMFLFVSVPLAENRQKAAKPGFEAYRAETRMFLPVPRIFRASAAETTEAGAQAE